jgi:cellulose synthase operon protein C
MRKVNCEACGAPYDVDPRRIPPNGMKMRCPACGASVQVMPLPAEGGGTAPVPRASPNELDLDLPAPKLPKNSPGIPSGLPPVKLPAKLAGKLPDLELSDLPALKSKLAAGPTRPAPKRPALSASAADDLTDLPTPKKPAPTGFGKLAPPPAVPKLDPGPFSDLEGEPSLPALKKIQPAVQQPVAARAPIAPPVATPSLPELDLPGLLAPRAPAAPAAATPSLPELDLPGLPAPRAAAAPAPATPSLPELDLPGLAPAKPAKPAAKPLAADPGADLPAPKPKAPVAAKPAAAAAGFDLDSPLAPVVTPKKSFAKPNAAPAEPRKPTPVTAPSPSASGSLSKDSLALEPSPFFANAAPLGMFGKLDDLEENKPPPAAPDVVDLPAPNDLPAVKRPSPLKGTSLGLGSSMPKDSLDLPGSFAAANAVMPVIAGVAPASAPALNAFAEPDTHARVPALSEIGLPAPRDLPVLKKPASQPALAPQAAHASSELDLPAPRDLPALKKPATTLGLGTSGGAPNPGYEAQSLGAQAIKQGTAAAARGIEMSLELPPMSGRTTSPELELGEFDRALEGLESKGGGSFAPLGLELELPPQRTDAAGSFGRLEPIALPSASVSNSNQLPMSTLELAPHELLMGADRGSGHALDKRSLPDLSSLAPLGLAPGAQSMPPLGPPTAQQLGGDDFGELDLGLGREPQAGLPLAIPARHGSVPSAKPGPEIEDAQLLGEEDYEAKLERKRKTGKSLPGWLLPVSLVAAIGAGGTALGMFTQHGWFGVYLLEQMLPAAGDPAQVKAAIEQAERQARTDAYVDARRALVTLSDARNEAGLSRELLARSLLHESLYQLRFGEDLQSAQRSAAILARVLERGTDVPGLALARAADAARRADMNEAKRLLAEAPREGDRFYGIVAGEIALLDKRWDDAVQMFTASARQGEVARAQWGIARARLAQGRPDAAEGAAQATLAASPLHSPAHALMAERALSRGDVEDALTHARTAAGRVAINGVQSRPSRAERAHAFSLEGRAEEQRDHPREAQASYELALASDPMSVPDLLGSARMSMRLGRPQEALSRFDSALNAKPSTSPDLTGRIPALEAGVGAVQALLALTRAEEALPRANALLAQAPADPEVRLWHGHVLEALERFDDADADYRGVIEKAPALFDGYVALSQLLFKRNRPEEAARVLAQATGQVKDSAEVRRMLGHSELTRTQLPEAIKQFEAALAFDAHDPGALYGLVVAQRKSGLLEAADATLDRLQAADPTFPSLSLERGQLLETRGQYEEAAQVYRKALVSRPNDSEVKLRLGAALVTAGHVDEAESVLNQVLKERPASAEAEHYLGRVLFARKETALAAQRFERAVNFDLRVPEYHMYLAWALLEQGDYGGALESVQRAIERDPNLGDARWLLGRIQLRTGAVKDALANFQTALRLKPGRIDAIANMGDAYDELRDVPNAIKSYQEAVRKAPDNAEWWYRLGQLLLDKGQREPARSALSEAVLHGDKLSERPSWLADAHRTYGDVLRETKRNAEAVEHYKLFLEMAPLGHPDRKEIEQYVYQVRH